MNKRIPIIIILVLGLSVIGAIAFFIFSYSNNSPKEDANAFIPDNSPTDVSPDANRQQGSPELKIIKPEPPVIDAVSVRRSDLERIARSFAERFGSFSNQSNFSNIRDLKMFMSANMKVWADNYIKKNQKTDLANEVYYGMTTKAMSTDTLTFDESNGEATVVVKTRRREAVGTTGNSSELFNQNIVVSFVKENDIWKVDSAFWQE